MSRPDWAVLGTLSAVPALDRPDLLGDPVVKALTLLDPAESALVGVAEIDPDLADTAAFCAAYSAPMDGSANCVVVAGRRGDQTRHAACLVLASTRADVNSVVRKRLNARRASFAPMDEAVALTGMEYGGITPSACRRAGRCSSTPPSPRPRPWSSAAGCGTPSSPSPVGSPPPSPARKSSRAWRVDGHRPGSRQARVRRRSGRT